MQSKGIKVKGFTYYKATDGAVLQRGIKIVVLDNEQAAVVDQLLDVLNLTTTKE